MDCERALQLISARLDGRIAGEEAARLDGHLRGCAACAASADALRRQDAELRRAFAPRRAAAAAVAGKALRDIARREAPAGGTGGGEGFASRSAATAGGQRPGPAPGPSSGARRGRFGWAGLLASAAAGFLLALALFRPWNPAAKGTKFVVAPPQPATRTGLEAACAAPPVGRLSLATGAIFVCPPAGTEWAPLATGGDLPADARVRTGEKVCCEFRMGDGSEIRLNENTEVHVRTPRMFDLKRGEAWSTVARSSTPFQVRMDVPAGGATPGGATPGGAAGEPRAPAGGPLVPVVVTALGTRFDLSADPLRPTLTVIEGKVAVQGRTSEGVVGAGERADLLGGDLGRREQLNELVTATNWVHEILVLKGRDDPELAGRIDDLLAQLGQTKLEHLYEQEIRALGDHCALPLTRYLQSERSKKVPDGYRRGYAARILGDVAQPWSIPDLIGLLADADGGVRLQAARALQRLSGWDGPAPPDVWRDNPPGQMRAAFDEWQEWWSRNKGRYPGAPRELRPVPSIEPLRKART